MCWWPGGVGEIDNKANSVQLQLQLPTRTELGNNDCELCTGAEWHTHSFGPIWEQLSTQVFSDSSVNE